PPRSSITPHLCARCARLPPPPPSFPTRRSSDLLLHVRRAGVAVLRVEGGSLRYHLAKRFRYARIGKAGRAGLRIGSAQARAAGLDRKSTRRNSSHVSISYAVFCLKKKNESITRG